MAVAAEALARPALFDTNAFAPLSRNPAARVRGGVAGVPFTAAIAIPDYGDRIAHHYRDTARDGLAAACGEASLSFDLEHCGLVVTFDRAAELPVHDGDMILDESIRAPYRAVRPGHPP